VFTFAAFLLWRFAAGISGDDPAGSLAASATNTLYVSSWAFTASVLFTQLHARAALAPAIAIAGCMAGLLAIFEVFTGNTVLNVSGLAGWSRGDPVLFDSLSTPKFREGVQRAQSTFSHPIVFGQFMAAVIPMGLHLILMRRGRNPVLGILLLLFCTVSIYLCNSRSPLFVALASASFYVAARYLYQSGASRNLGLAILAVTAAAVGGLFFVEDVVRLLAGRTSVEAGSSEARGAMIAYGLNAILDRPLVGYGEGRSVYVAGLVGQGDQLTIDNYFLSIAIDFGIPGFVIFSVFSLSVVMGWRNVGGDIRRIEQDMLVAVLAAAFGIMIGQSVISIDENMTYFYLSTGYLIAATGLNRALTSKSLPLARRS
jgi:O-antigen ligase